MTIATAFAADMPQDVEVPRIRPRNSKRRVPTLIISPLTSVTDESCCDAGPEDSVPVAKDKALGISTECAETELSATEARASGPAKGKTWTFSLSIGGANPLQIKGTISEVEMAMPAVGGH